MVSLFNEFLKIIRWDIIKCIWVSLKFMIGVKD